MKTQLTAQEVIDKCTVIYEDISLNYVSDWKAKNAAKAFGFMPVYFPRELVYAAGILPVGIMGGGDQIEIIKGDAYYQSYICHIPRSTIELGLAGHLNALDGMAFPSICDVIRNLSGMWKLMFPEKESIYFDLPQNFKESIGGTFYTHDLKRILGILESMSGKKVTTSDLNSAFELYNINRRLVQKMYQMRSEQPWMIPTYELYILLRAGLVLDVKEHNDLLTLYINDVSTLDRRPLDNSRVIIVGSFCEQPPMGLIRSLERAGCYIVDDDYVLVSRFIKSDIPLTDNPIEALSNAYLQNSMEAPFKYNPDTKGEQLKDSYEQNKADGVIFAAASFCDPALLDRPMLSAYCDKHKIPYTTFKYAENTGQFQVIREQAGTFADSLKLWETV